MVLVKANNWYLFKSVLAAQPQFGDWEVLEFPDRDVAERYMRTSGYRCESHLYQGSEIINVFRRDTERLEGMQTDIP